jgi:hypothetical protein
VDDGRVAWRTIVRWSDSSKLVAQYLLDHVELVQQHECCLVSRSPVCLEGVVDRAWVVQRFGEWYVEVSVHAQPTAATEMRSSTRAAGCSSR